MITWIKTKLGISKLERIIDDQRVILEALLVAKGQLFTDMRGFRKEMGRLQNKHADLKKSIEDMPNLPKA